jgi:hypothetical protein
LHASITNTIRNGTTYLPEKIEGRDSLDCNEELHAELKAFDLPPFFESHKGDSLSLKAPRKRITPGTSETQ